MTPQQGKTMIPNPTLITLYNRVQTAERAKQEAETAVATARTELRTFLKVDSDETAERFVSLLTESFIVSLPEPNKKPNVTTESLPTRFGFLQNIIRVIGTDTVRRADIVQRLDAQGLTPNSRDILKYLSVIMAQNKANFIRVGDTYKVKPSVLQTGKTIPFKRKAKKAKTQPVQNAKVRTLRRGFFSPKGESVSLFTTIQTVLNKNVGKTMRATDIANVLVKAGYRYEGKNLVKSVSGLMQRANQLQKLNGTMAQATA